jgi:hypothetical protein
LEVSCHFSLVLFGRRRRWAATVAGRIAAAVGSKLSGRRIVDGGEGYFGSGTRLRGVGRWRMERVGRCQHEHVWLFPLVECCLCPLFDPLLWARASQIIGPQQAPTRLGEHRRMTCRPKPQKIVLGLLVGCWKVLCRKRGLETCLEK